MGVFLGRKMDLGVGMGGYNFEVTAPTPQDRELYQAGREIEELLRREEMDGKTELEKSEN